jgi:hypothetical protein
MIIHTTYEGMFKCDKYHGIGKLIQADACYKIQNRHICGKYKTIFEGEFAHGYKHGTGSEFNFSSHWQYNLENRNCFGTNASETGGNQILYMVTEGEWSRGLMVRGEIRHITGNWSYKGDLNGSSYHGKGVYKMGPLPDIPSRLVGYAYEGDFLHGQEHGKGIYTSNEEVYDGEWQNGKRQGQGVQCLADGSIYDGEWHDSTRHGIGVLTNVDGSRFSGKWSNGKLTQVTKSIRNNDPGPSIVIATFDSLLNQIRLSRQQLQVESESSKKRPFSCMCDHNVKDRARTTKALPSNFETSKCEFNVTQANRNFDSDDAILRRYIVDMNWTYWDCLKMFNIGRVRYNRIKNGKERQVKAGGRLKADDECYREGVYRSFEEYIRIYIDAKDKQLSLINCRSGVPFEPNYLNWKFERDVYADYLKFEDALRYQQQTGVAPFSKQIFSDKIKKSKLYRHIINRRKRYELPSQDQIKA